MSNHVLAADKNLTAAFFSKFHQNCHQAWASHSKLECQRAQNIYIQKSQAEIRDQMQSSTPERAKGYSGIVPQAIQAQLRIDSVRRDQDKLRTLQKEKG